MLKVRNYVDENGFLAPGRARTLGSWNLQPPEGCKYSPGAIPVWPSKGSLEDSKLHASLTCQPHFSMTRCQIYVESL